ncbi:phragmoplastin interacting protein 1 [Arachis stenosperma]|uniref:phragmoplastin interacting protein 1 n=1 Tax=Arachis stenosperma TaxID=217475 RepID=UPI0025AC09FA|nr:phragmoplastin interacting protein 1 [Arachis stenosperma]
MVLSNKKLKQKLRAALAKQQSNSDVVGVDAPSSSSPSSHSLKTLLDSSAHKPVLSKREKRRKLRSLEHPPAEASPQAAHEVEGSNKENGSEGLGSKKKNKKRKVKEDADVATEAPNDAEKSTNKKEKKKKKKKQQKKKKKTKTVEQNNSNHEGEVPQATVLNESSNNTNANSSQDGCDDPTKVYVGGIPYYSTEDDIRSYFESCGTITEVDCMCFPESGKFRGIAIISFKTEAAAKRALALDGADMGGLFLKIQPYKATRINKVSDFAPKIMEGYNRIYVGNLSWDITEEELRKFFSNCNIASLRFGMDKDTGEFRGYAHVDFSDSQSLKTALTMDQKLLSGRPVRISCAVPLKKKPTTHTTAATTTTITSNGADGEKSTSTVSAVSGKIKRRTCYECGEKGHLSSDCPKKQTMDPAST